MKKFLSIAAVAILLISAFLSAGQVNASATLPDYEPVDWRSGLAGSIATPKVDSTGSLKSIEEVDPAVLPVGTWAYDWYLGATTGNPLMQLRAVVGNAEVWVASDVGLKFPEGDPRNADPKNWQITDDMAEYIATEFDDVIYPIDTTYFGTPWDRDGADTIFEQLGWPSVTYDWLDATDNPQRTIIKVFNIQDEGYYDPTYPYYTVGFFSPSYTGYYDRNMIHIDNWRWWQRLGPEGTQWYPDTNPELVVNRPHVYESTVAHEYQHLIHDDWNPDDPLFMNEGCSMYAEYLCGYGIDPDYFNSYLYTPDNSLTEWGDQGEINILADYGAAALWAVYLSDHYGGANLLSYFMQNGVPGIEGINQALQHSGYSETFDDVYHDWRIANLIHTDQIGNGKYNYETIDLNSPDVIPTRTYTIKTSTVKPTRSANFGWTYTILGYNTLTYKLPEYGSDYVKFTGLSQKQKPVFTFDGQNLAGAQWVRTDMDGDGDKEWFSTQAINLADISIIADVDLSGMASATLTFDTYVNTEGLWDYGFVQVSSNNGATWTSLQGTYTTEEHDPSAHPNIVANLPGYTGDSGGWISDTMDLTPYVGQAVKLRFRYMTDWATLNPGWAVDDIAINGDVIDDADTTLAFATYPPLFDVDWKVTLISVETDDGLPKYKRIETLALNDVEETARIGLDKFIENGYVLLIMSPDHGWTDYTFSIQKS